jgi:hypothetical protein
MPNETRANPSKLAMIGIGSLAANDGAGVTVALSTGTTLSVFDRMPSKS